MSDIYLLTENNRNELQSFEHFVSICNSSSWSDDLIIQAYIICLNLEDSLSSAVDFAINKDLIDAGYGTEILNELSYLNNLDIIDSFQDLTYYTDKFFREIGVSDDFFEEVESICSSDVSKDEFSSLEDLIDSAFSVNKNKNTKTLKNINESEILR